MGRAARSAVWGDQFSYNLLLTALPFVLVLAVAFGIEALARYIAGVSKGKGIE